MYEKLYRLVDGLVAKTQEGSLNWKDTASPSIFQAVVSGYNLHIEEASEGRPEADYYISLYNKDGAIVEHISDRDLNRESGSFGREHTNYYMVLKDMFELIKRRSMGIDKILDEVLVDLEDDHIPF